MPEVRSHTIELLSTNRGVGMEIKPPLDLVKRSLILGSLETSAELRTIMTRTIGGMSHGDSASYWGTITNEASRTRDTAQLRKLAHNIAHVLEHLGYAAQIEDKLQ